LEAELKLLVAVVQVMVLAGVAVLLQVAVVPLLPPTIWVEAVFLIQVAVLEVVVEHLMQNVCRVEQGLSL
jgi:hypothetical protein